MNRFNLKVALIIVSSLLLVAFGIPAQAKVTVDIWNVWGAAGAQLLTEALQPFLAQHPDIDVIVRDTFQGTQQRDKLLTSIVAGTPPDIVFMVSPVAEMAGMGGLTPLDDMIAKSKVIRREDYPSGMLDIFKVNGVTYGIPGGEVGPWMGMLMNADVMEGSGVPAKSPASLDELLKVHKKLTRVDDAGIVQIGYSPMAGMPLNYFPEIYPFMFDIRLYDAANGKINVDTPEMHRLVDYLASFYEVMPAAAVDAFHKQYGSWWDCMTSGKAAMQVQGYFTPGRLITTKATEKYRYEYGWVPNIRGDKLQVLGGWGMVMPKGAPHPVEAFQIMEYLTTAEPAKLLYARNGWLNGNLSAMKQLDVANNTGLQWYIQSLSQANRILVPESVPIINDVRSTLYGNVMSVLRGQSSPAQALSSVQTKLQALLDSALKK